MEDSLLDGAVWSIWSTVQLHPCPSARPSSKGTLRPVPEVSRRQLGRSLTGFNRDGKGLKRADFYDLFFEVPEQVLLGTHAALKLMPFTKSSSSGNRYAKMLDGGWLPNPADVDLPDDIRVDQLAEWCYWIEGLVQESRPDADVPLFLLRPLGLEDLRTNFDAIPRDNRAGGVGYHWYFAAGHYLKRHPEHDPTDWEQLIENVAKSLAAYLGTTKPADKTASSDVWAELRAYISQSLSIGPTTIDKPPDQDLFTSEFRRYHQAKRTGQGRSALCTLCSSPFDVSKQQETATLFSPQVYSNKLPLHGSTAIRDICPICGLETMLRQLLMNRSNVSGGRFEGREIRYLYFYPTYFFTPETLEVFRTVHNRLQRIGVTELRRQFVGDDAQDRPVLHLDPHTSQRLEPLLLSADDLSSRDEDRLVDLYRQFYRASRYNSNSILRPMVVAAKTILTADPRLFERDELTEAVRGELAAFMERVRNNRADGTPSPRLMDESPEQAARRRENAMQRFAEYVVGTIFYDTFRGDVAALRGRQLNLLRSACEVLYQDAAARDRQDRQAMEEQAPEQGEEEEVSN